MFVGGGCWRVGTVPITLRGQWAPCLLSRKRAGVDVVCEAEGPSPLCAAGLFLPSVWCLLTALLVSFLAPVWSVLHRGSLKICTWDPVSLQRPPIALGAKTQSRCSPQALQCLAPSCPLPVTSVAHLPLQPRSFPSQTVPSSLPWDLPIPPALLSGRSQMPLQDPA